MSSPGFFHNLFSPLFSNASSKPCQQRRNAAAGIASRAIGKGALKPDKPAKALKAS
jgi:hypothetical protein